MPYVTKEERQPFGDTPETLGNMIASAGELNYVLTTTILAYLKWKGLRYQEVAEITGVLENIKQELYRRIVGHYEELKIAENSDIPLYVDMENDLWERTDKAEESK